ncbi:MAG: hypothetical protein KGY99_09655 [Phycisphaerae bacterium]|nr:hypothetical protein [Phycisphaerae bacterium]
MTAAAQLRQFVRRLQRRLNARQAVTAALIALVVAAFGALVVAAGFVLSGYRVQRTWLLIPATAAAVVGIGAYVLRRCTADGAARRADAMFALREGLISSLAFQRTGRHGAFYDLQLRDTLTHARDVDVTAIRVRPHWLAPAIAAALLAATAWLCTLPDSPLVRQARAEADRTRARSAEVKEHLQAYLADMRGDMDDDELRRLAKAKLVEQVEQLKVTGDRKAALRQYARIERTIRKLAERTALKRDEQFADACAEQCAKSSDADVETLARDLSDKRYKDAADTLDALKQGANESPDKAKKPHDKLDEAVRRLAKAARQRADLDSALKQRAEQVCKASERLGKAVQAAEREAQRTGECRACKAGMLKEQKDADEAIGRLARHMDEMDGKRTFLARMDGMLKQLGRCQGYMRSDAVALLPQKSIGAAKDGRLGDPQSDADTGELTRLRGQLGSGPSRVAVEHAADGSGVSHLASAERDARFRAQVESFVHREDVPHTLTQGVKRYFELIHRTPQTGQPDAAPAQSAGGASSPPQE